MSSSRPTPANLAKKADPKVTVVDPMEELSKSFRAEHSPDHKVTQGWLDLNDMTVDPRVQRPQKISLVNAIAKKFNRYAMGSLSVSVRVDPESRERTYVIIDGQQRRAGALKAGHNERVHVIMHHGLVLKDEARLFRELNFRKSVLAVESFKVAVYEEDPYVLAVKSILEGLGISFGTAKGFMAVQTGLRLVRRRNGATNLHWALDMIQKIYDADGAGNCYDGVVVEAFALLHEKHGSRIDEANLINKLSAVGGGTANLIGQGQTVRSVRGGRIGVNLIDAIILRYNKGKHAGSHSSLPPWDRRTGPAASEASTEAKEEATAS